MNETQNYNLAMNSANVVADDFLRALKEYKLDWLAINVDVEEYMELVDKACARMEKFSGSVKHFDEAVFIGQLVNRVHDDIENNNNFGGYVKIPTYMQLESIVKKSLQQ